MPCPDWPLADLRLWTGDLLLRPMTEADLPVGAAAVPADLELDPSATRFAGLDESTSRRVIVQQSYWRAMGTWSVVSWRLPFVVSLAGTFVGVQERSIRATGPST